MLYRQIITCRVESGDFIFTIVVKECIEVTLKFRLAYNDLSTGPAQFICNVKLCNIFFKKQSLYDIIFCFDVLFYRF
jgi:hypothetical protein